ncbi:Guanine deaminase [Croceitalea dokdonensis DOKDO 023]|uniref:Guanine deaminase n=1 Tax=Croceitalea dokdonensis DOKDO 023 TaxID=1300341 RepID=A0A0P7AZV8_9FLAO|nr:nucleoside deaminase [Croceitalea dokdonensis]KPM32149.1 Guanine deaminase [Croceitalea dokdonensis DOKDO 023]
MENHNQHYFFMRRAIAWARHGKAKDQSAFGAVIVKNGKIVTEVHNTVKQQQDCTQHAELSAIQTACNILQCKQLKGCTLYTSCEPCMMCLGACYWSGLEQIFYGASAQDAKDFGFVYSDMFYASNKEDRYKTFSMRQLLRDEALTAWNGPGNLLTQNDHLRLMEKDVILRQKISN